MAASILSALLSLSLVRRFIERYATHKKLGDDAPRDWIAWGWYETGRNYDFERGYAETRPFFSLRLPGVYMERYDYARKWGWHRHYAVWGIYRWQTEDYGWGIVSLRVRP